MDKYDLFIPKDETIKKEYVGFKKLCLFRIVPKNCKLLCVNIFTGNSKVKKQGLRFIAPWCKSRLVSCSDCNIDYPKYDFKTSDGLMVTADIAITLKISNPEKFEFNSINPMQEYNVTVQDLLRRFISNKTTDELYAGNFDLTDLDPKRRNPDGTTGQSVLESFEEKYGIKTIMMQSKRFDPPKSMIDDYEKKVVQEKENQRILMDAQNRLNVAKIEAETLKINSEARALAKQIELNAKIEVLKEKCGMNDEMIKDYLLADVYSTGSASVITTIGNSNNSTEMISALSAINNPKKRTREKNAE